MTYNCPKDLNISYLSVEIMNEKQPEKKWEHPYISFDEALEIANKIKDMGKPSTDALAKALGDSNAGWFRLKIASIRRWGLADGWGDLSVTQHYKDILNEKKPNHASEVKRELFLNIPLFKDIYETYKDNGLPQEPYLTNAIGDKYNLKGRNPNLVANIARDFISKYFPNYGREEHNEPEMSSSKPETIKSSIEKLSIHEGDFPIQIITRDNTFKWDVKEEVDWTVIDSVINSIKERWKKSNSTNKKRE